MPRSVLADSDKLDRSNYPDEPLWIEFALRHELDYALYKLISVSSESTILTIKQYILERLVPQISMRKGRPPVGLQNIEVYWLGKTMKEVLFKDHQTLQELISGKYWRVDNLTPGLDLLHNFYHCAVQEGNYEQIREKLYFRLV